jgi:hypothetical protein
MDVFELLRRAADLVPPHARSDAGLTVDDVRDYLREHEWEVAFGILEDFDGVQWRTVEFWDLLADAAQQMLLRNDAAWCQSAERRDPPRHHQSRPAARCPGRWRSSHASPRDWTTATDVGPLSPQAGERL